MLWERWAKTGSAAFSYHLGTARVWRARRLSPAPRTADAKEEAHAIPPSIDDRRCARTDLGAYYFNVHDAPFQAGALRGQLTR
jgi:hypothetical protein